MSEFEQRGEPEFRPDAREDARGDEAAVEGVADEAGVEGVADDAAVEAPAVVEDTVVDDATESPIGAAMRELDTLADRDLAEHPDVYQRIHSELQAALTTIDNA